MFFTLMSLKDIEIETESKNSNILMYGYNAGQPMAIPIYTVLPYCVILTLAELLITMLLLFVLAGKISQNGWSTMTIRYVKCLSV